MCGVKIWPCAVPHYRARMAENPTIGELYNAKAILEADFVAAIDNKI